jgi:hypothetical protein
MITALRPLSLSIAFCIGWTASRIQIRQRQADRFETRFLEQDSLVLTPEELVRAAEGL